MSLPSRPPLLGSVVRRRASASAARVAGAVGLSGLALALVALGALGACGLDRFGLEGVDASADSDATVLDATAEAGPDGPSEASAESSTVDGALDGRAVDAGADADAGARLDASADVGVDACGPVEICDDGIDDDCNGLVDCADPRCQSQGFTCMPVVPGGWSLVAYDPGGRPACASGWGSPVPLVEGPDAGPASCACSCGAPIGNPCVAGTATMSLGQNVCGCAKVHDVPLVSDGGCDPIGAPIGEPCGAWGDGFVQAVVLEAGAEGGAAAVACTDDPQRPPITYAALGESCTAQGPAGGGCVSGGGCLPAPAPGIACIEAAGIQTCPPGFTQAHVVYAPSNVIDERQCGPCGCTATVTSCSGATVTLYDDPACTQNPVPLTADGKCDALQGDPSDAGWFQYTASPTTTPCGSPTTTGLDGGLLLRAPATVCCP